MYLPKDDSFPCYEGVGRASRGVAPELDEFGQRRVMLIETLRDRAKWPEGFEWYFPRCHSCAIGLWTAKFEGRAPAGSDEWMRLAQTLGLTEEQVDETFDSYGGSYYGCATGQVTPEMVADRLEQVHRSILHPSEGRASP